MGTQGHAGESVRRERTRSIPILLMIVGMSAGMVMALPVPAPAAEGTCKDEHRKRSYP